MYPGALAQTIPDRPAVIMASSGRTLTYRDLDEASNRGAQLFRSLGLRTGDHVSIHLENHPLFFPVVWAAQRSGLVYTTISSRLTAPEVEYPRAGRDPALDMCEVQPHQSLFPTRCM